ncbi:cyclin-like protein [Scheffersomyces coipomensis]|uniref:cyclin-like protein n=1 Tax=Scheffersomyces coipomensis TaxID=1788519 RepID=UPI00315DF04F
MSNQSRNGDGYQRNPSLSPQADGVTPTGSASSVPIANITQIARPYFTSSELRYLHNKSIKESEKLHYSRTKHQVFQFCFQIIKQLKFPLRVLSTTMNYYQRWYLFNKFDIEQHDVEDKLTLAAFEKDPYVIATTCLFLACKNEDCIKKLKDIQAVANKIREIDESKYTNERTTSSILAAANAANNNTNGSITTAGSVNNAAVVPSSSSNIGSGIGVSSGSSSIPAPVYYTVGELHRKATLSLEFKLLQIIKFDFNNGGSTNLKLTTDQLLIQFCKKININYKFSMFCWLVNYDLIPTSLPLTVPPHCIALAIIIVTLNLKPFDLKIAHFKDVNDSETEISEKLDNIDSEIDFKCPEVLVNEAIIFILDFYIHEYSKSLLSQYLPLIDEKSGKDQVFKFMELKSKFNDLRILTEKSSSTQDLLTQDHYLNIWDYSIAAKGSTRFMSANKRRKFAKEL